MKQTASKERIEITVIEPCVIDGVKSPPDFLREDLLFDNGVYVLKSDFFTSDSDLPEDHEN
jgi:hypothetical protein